MNGGIPCSIRTKENLNLMFCKHRIVAVAAAALGTAALALAPTAVRADTASLTVTATVSNTCQFNTTTDTVGFGTYTGAAIVKTYTAKYTCTSGDSTYKFSFVSLNRSGANCEMSDGAGHSLNYVVADSAGNFYGCDGFTAGAAAEPAGNGGALSYGFTFTLPASQTLIAGSYGDTNTVTITP